MTLGLVLFPFAEEYQSMLLGYGVLLGGGLFAVGSIGFFVEQRRPSRWNQPPRWLEEARARGELD